MDTYKVLGQVVTTGDENNDVVVYSPPENTQASLSNISITNTSDTAQTYDLAFARSNELLDGYEEVIDRPTFVTLGSTSSTAATSPDGITWPQRTLPTAAHWQSGTSGNDTVVVVSYSSAVSTNPGSRKWGTRSH